MTCAVCGEPLVGEVCALGHGTTERLCARRDSLARAIAYLVCLDGLTISAGLREEFRVAEAAAHEALMHPPHNDVRSPAPSL